MKQESKKVENNNKRVISIVIFGIVLLILVGITFAHFMLKKESDFGEMKAAKLNINFTENNELLMSNALPIYEEDIESKASYITFSFVNSSTTDTYVDIYLSNMTIPNALKDYDFKWSLETSDNSSFTNSIKVSTGNFLELDTSDSTNIKKLLVPGYTIAKNSTKYFRVRVWLNENEKDQSAIAGSTFKAKISYKASVSTPNTLAYKILGNNNSNVLTNTLEFDKETTDLGLYVQKDNSEKSEFGFPVYYYRGEVTNNYVNFAGQDWRIMGINEDGTIKLAGLTTVDATLDMTKDYATDTLSFDDYIGTNLNNWYNSNITGTNDSLVATENFCYDKTNTFDDLNPTLNCRDTNGTVVTKIGTFSTDELMYAGAFIEGFAGNNNNFYLAGDFENTTQTTLTFGLNSNNKVYPYKLTTAASTRSDNIIPMEFSGQNTQTINVRPVINLKSNVTITGGTGTKVDPYVIG